MTHLWAILLFSLGAAFVLYMVAGYPLVLAVLARWRPRPVDKHFEERTVTVLLAVHNGEAWLKAKLESILSLHYPRRLMRILVISDGSTDRTDLIAAEFAGEGIELLRVPRGGKAAALNAGMARATVPVRLAMEPSWSSSPRRSRNGNRRTWPAPSKRRRCTIQ